MLKSIFSCRSVNIWLKKNTNLFALVTYNWMWLWLKDMISLICDSMCTCLSSEFGSRCLHFSLREWSDRPDTIHPGDQHTPRSSNKFLGVTVLHWVFLSYLHLWSCTLCRLNLQISAKLTGDPKDSVSLLRTCEKFIVFCESSKRIT